ncbi:6-phosphogluconolactonase [Candidatus Hydrogenedentota bacterium]
MSRECGRGSEGEAEFAEAMVYTFPDSDTLSEGAASHIAELASATFERCGRFSLVLSGGKTPSGTYRVLARKLTSSQWNMVHVYWGDERCVPPSSVDSNYRMAQRSLLDIACIPSSQVHRIEAEDPDSANAAERYDEIFPERPDLLVLGVGSDGHTASLFPKSPLLHEEHARFAPVQAPVDPRKRISLAPLGIKSASNILVLVSGEGKADAVKRVFHKQGDIFETPARLVTDAVWFVTEGAAGAVPEFARSADRR